jgi:predicted Zn-dependent peptidase
MSYAPSSGYSTKDDYGIFMAAADVDLDKIELTRVLLEAEVEKLKQGRMEAKRLGVVKEQILWGLARSYESNSYIAALYISYLPDLKMRGKLTNHEASIAKVTPEDIYRVANKYLQNDARVIVRSKPMLTFTQFYIGLGVFAVTIPSMGFYLLLRFFKRRREGCKA